MQGGREVRQVARDSKPSAKLTESRQELRVARMEPPLRRKLYTLGNRLDNPK